jgi:predicted nucleotidyltransferase
MVDIVKNNLDKIIHTCEEMQIKSLFLIGSGARGNDFNRKSDPDFIFRFKYDKDGYPLAGFDYFDLLFKLQEITGRKVDLIAEERIINKYFLERVNEEKICLYES